VNETPLVILRELVQEDEGRSVVLAALDRLLDETAAVRERTERLRALFLEAPSERARIDGEIDAAELEVHQRSAAVAEAEAELAAAEAKADEERIAAANRFLVRARDALAVAEKRATAFRSEASELERRLADAEREVPQIESRAVELANSLRDRPRLAQEAACEPPPGLAGVAEWTSSARAALVVARSGVAAEQEAVIRQANELGSVILGEPLVASSAAVVARRVEQALGSSAARQS
jgi:chromosome segregation ATPase